MANPTIPQTGKVYRLPSSKDQYTDASCLRVVEEPIQHPSKGQVLVKMHAASINFRYTLYIATACLFLCSPSTPLNRDLLVLMKAFPGEPPADLIPFSDGAGQVVAIGEGVTKFSIGDRVVNSMAIPLSINAPHRHSDSYGYNYP